MVSKVTDLNGISRYCSLVKHREFKGYYNKPKYTPFYSLNIHVFAIKII